MCPPVRYTPPDVQDADPETPSSEPRPARRSVPFGVIVVALGFVLNATLFALVLAGLRTGSALAERMLGDLGTLTPVYIGLVALQFLAALLLLRLHPRGWTLAMVVVCIGLAIFIGGWYIGTPDYLRMAIFATMAFYLNQREVRAAFGVTSARPAVAPDENGAAP